MPDHAHNLRARFRAQTTIGVITRGTTHSNRLRRCDRWMHYHSDIQRSLIHAEQPLVIDLGYGASHTTTCEWARWLRKTRADVDVLGLEIDPARVLPPRENVRFARGGFELAGNTPVLVRALNVLRQYDASQVTEAWEQVCGNLALGGYFIEGTCDELGRRCSWVLLDARGPQSLTLAWDPHHSARPSDLAERLPKALIHRNIVGENIYALLREADAAWDRAAGWAPYGPRVRWREARELLIGAGIPLEPVRRRIRDNILTVPWAYVA